MNKIEYIVMPNDTLFLIAQRFGVTINQILAANPEIKDPNMIFVGQHIFIPSIQSSSNTMMYTVQYFETLYLISWKFGTTVPDILKLNPNIVNPNLIYPGQRILIPIVGPVCPPGCMVYISNLSGNQEIWRSSAVGENPVQLTNTGSLDSQLSNPKWSPDSKHVAYLFGRKLYVMDSDGKNKKQLAENVSYYSWSNNSIKIAYSNETEEPLLNSTFITDLKGNTNKIAVNFNNPIWFPGNKQLAGFKQEEATFARLVTINIDGTNLKEYEVPAAVIELSPNSRYAATQLLSGSAYTIFSGVWIYDFVIEKRIQLPGFQFEDQPGHTIDYSILGGWSPDSSRIVYSTLISDKGDGEIRIALPKGNVFQILPMNFYPKATWGPSMNWITYVASKEPGEYVFLSSIPRNIYVRNIFTNQEILVTPTGDNYDVDWNI